jgi:hypothetical protein
MAKRNKLYYPKSHIITGLYTTGKQWMLESNIEYIGYYHSYIDGTVLTGAVYNEMTSEKLIPYIDVIANPETVLYDTLKPRYTYTSPITKYPEPTLEDYKNGFFTRYILRRRNYKEFMDMMEIDLAQYQSWQRPKSGINETIYDAIQIDWKLTGPLTDANEVFGVQDTNRRLVLLKERTFVGLKNFLTDYIEWSVYSPFVDKSIKQLFVK